MATDFDKIYRSVSDSLNLSEKALNTALSLAIEDAVKDYFKVAYARVDLRAKTVCVIFTVSINITLKKALKHDPDVQPHDPLGITFDMQSFPENLISKIRNNFDNLLFKSKNEESFNYWTTQIHRVVKGIIIEKYRNHMDIELLGEQIGMMKKRDWVPVELSLYYKGSVLYFYVTKVDKNPLKVHLSRSSISFPAKMLQFHLPFYNFKCKRRFIGHKSVLFTNAPLDKKLADIRDKVSCELNGEILEIRRFPAF
ncbi:MAG: hypothetical protein PVH36_01040 [Desulfobacterales bacterium]|jgi:hypothetical protein